MKEEREGNQVKGSERRRGKIIYFQEAKREGKSDGREGTRITLERENRSVLGLGPVV